MFVCVWFYFYTHRKVSVCTCVCVWVFEYLSACVSLCICMQVALFFMCVLKGYSHTVKFCPPARRFGLAFLGPLRPARLGLGCPDPTEPVPARHVNLAFWIRAPCTTLSPPSSMLRLVHVLFFWSVAVLVCLSRPSQCIVFNETVGFPLSAPGLS